MTTDSNDPISQSIDSLLRAEALRVDRLAMESCNLDRCSDCGLPYEDIPMDTTLSDKQWLMIHPEGLDGILCANCIVNRAAKIPTAISMRARIDLGNDNVVVKIKKFFRRKRLEYFLAHLEEG